ncbi:hypothetical protein [uncultured Brevibacterium sp.]|uniref:hypothetical protein n=1 Tax=uncultured Brevibacterium sp. TaxID=189678 RepID=UPI0025F8523F|nr:hypothetical protein [uncultured Brevibacterium sp.]
MNFDQWILNALEERGVRDGLNVDVTAFSLELGARREHVCEALENHVAAGKLRRIQQVGRPRTSNVFIRV